MATITRESIASLNEKIKITVSGEDYLPEFEKSIKKLCKTSSLPGFRKGMVSPSLIRRMHGRSLFTEEVLHAVEKELKSYLEKEKPDIIGQPVAVEANRIDMMDMDHPAPYEFVFEIGLKPSFDIPLIRKKSTYVFYEVTANEQELDEEILHMREREGTLSSPSLITSEEDIIKVSFKEIRENENRNENQPESAGYQFNDQMYINWFTPVLREEIMKKSLGDHLEITPSDGFDSQKMDYCLKELKKIAEDMPQRSFLMKIDEIFHVEKPPTDDSFFEKIFPDEKFSDLTEFRNRVREMIKMRYRNDSLSYTYYQQIREILLNGTPIELPEAFLKRWLKLKNDPQIAHEPTEEEYTKFIRQLRWTLIRDKLSRENQLHLTNMELQQRMEDDLVTYYPHLLEGEIPKMLEKMQKNTDYLQQVYDSLMDSKVLSWVYSVSAIREEAVSLESFVDIIQKHHSHVHE
ncbi:MAG TPA: trigger factor [Chitinophagaceae bacterium]|nr:trigger factor [Chitinophagaceae bacterium]